MKELIHTYQEADSNFYCKPIDVVFLTLALPNFALRFLLACVFAYGFFLLNKGVLRAVFID
jgi:hypothetical protein